MKAEYVTDTSGWKKWQCDYRLGLILIMPPDEVGGSVNALQAKYDPPTYAFCPAHITLSDPLGLEMTPEKDAEITRSLSSVEPFMLHFDKPHASRERGGVAYPIHPREPIDTLRATLHQASVFTRRHHTSLTRRWCAATLAGRQDATPIPPYGSPFGSVRMFAQNARRGCPLLHAWRERRIFCAEKSEAR